MTHETTTTNQPFNPEEFKNRVHELSDSEIFDELTAFHNEKTAAREQWLAELKHIRKHKAEAEPRAKRSAAKKSLKELETVPGFRRNANHFIDTRQAKRDIQDATDEIDNYVDQVGLNDLKIIDELEREKRDWQTLGGTAVEAAMANVEELNKPNTNPLRTVNGHDRMRAQIQLGKAQKNFADGIRTAFNVSAEPVADTPAPTSMESAPAPAVATPEATPAPAVVDSAEKPAEPSHDWGKTFLGKKVIEQLEAEGETPESLRKKHEEADAEREQKYGPRKVASAKEAAAKIDDFAEKFGQIESDRAAIDSLADSIDSSRFDRFKENLKKVFKNRDRSQKRTTKRAQWRADMIDTLKATPGYVSEKAVKGKNYLNDRLSPSYVGNLVTNWDKNDEPEADAEAKSRISVVEYEDGESALNYQRTGDQIELGPGSIQKYARNFDLDDMAIIQTESGKEYALLKGLLIDREARKIYNLPYNDISLTIGKNGSLPRIGKIDSVKKVQLRYKVGIQGESSTPNPFKYYIAEVDKALKSRS